MKQPRVADQIAELERYLTVAENGILKHDALEVLTWDYMRMSSAEHVKQRAQQLLAMDPGNPVALAALAEEGVTQPGGAPAAPSRAMGMSNMGMKKTRAISVLIPHSQRWRRWNSYAGRKGCRPGILLPCVAG